MTSQKKTNSSFEILLENKMESLDINEARTIEKPSCSKEPVLLENPYKRVLRCRILPRATDNRRVLTKPKKRVLSNTTNASIENLYMCKQVKRLPPNLETIFEEPKVSKNNELIYIGLRKQKRVILFEESSKGKGKVKKRQMKAKKMFGKTSIKKKTATMDALLEKLSFIE